MSQKSDLTTAMTVRILRSQKEGLERLPLTMSASSLVRALLKLYFGHAGIQALVEQLAVKETARAYDAMMSHGVKGRV
jgi:hypothetical protein